MALNISIPGRCLLHRSIIPIYIYFLFIYLFIFLTKFILSQPVLHHLHPLMGTPLITVWFMDLQAVFTHRAPQQSQVHLLVGLLVEHCSLSVFLIIITTISCKGLYTQQHLACWSHLVECILCGSYQKPIWLSPSLISVFSWIIARENNM